jgi:signal transduction histidine kinase
MKRRITELIEELHDGFCSLRTTGELIYANKSAKTLLKIDDENSINFFDSFIKKEDSIKKIKDAVVNQNGLKDLECDLFNLKGERFPVILTINIIHDIDNSVVGFACLFKDMSALREVNAQLMQAQKMESIGMLASGIAHEFNNLLSGILPNAELIKMTLKDDEANQARAESILTSAKRAGNIVKQLLSFARHDQFDEDVSLNLNHAVTETLEIMGKFFGKEIIIENKLPINLPNIKIDPTRIQQIIMNLAINARDALQGSGKITFSAKPVGVGLGNANGLMAGKYVKLSVKDDGNGIAPENIERIFDPFFTTKEPGKGTGLGLSTVYGIVKNLNGDIKVTSEPGKGTQFDLYFPLSNSNEESAVFEENENIQQQPRNKTILIVDDEKVILDMARDMLGYIGFKTVCASSADEALKIYKKEKSNIDVLVIDLLMPKVNGITCFKKIRKINPTVPVIITSGIGEANMRDDVLKLGANEYLQKPYDVKSFANVFDAIFPI